MAEPVRSWLPSTLNPTLAEVPLPLKITLHPRRAQSLENHRSSSKMIEAVLSCTHLGQP